MPELTPEERQRIYEEEKARFEAQKRVQAEAKSGGNSKYFLGCFVLFIFAFLLLLAFSEEAAHKRVQEQPELTQEQKLRRYCHEIKTDKGSKPISELSMEDLDNIRMCRALGYYD